MQGLALMLTQHSPDPSPVPGPAEVLNIFFFVQRHIYLCTMEKEEGTIEVLGINDTI